MLKWSAVFFIISIITGTLGFTDVAGSSMTIAKFLFFIFLIPGVLLLVLGLSIFRKL